MASAPAVASIEARQMLTDVQPSNLEAEPVKAVRGCDGCTLCCKVMGVAAIDKPRGKWCAHCKLGTGCGIYETRPTECRTFMCGYLVKPGLSEAWKPSTSRMIISNELAQNRINIHVDLARPDAWQRQPYYAEIKTWARHITADRGQLVVLVGDRQIVILPDHDVDLGIVDPEEIVVITETPASQGGRVYEAYAVRRDQKGAAEIDAARGNAVPLAVGAMANFRKGRRLG
jgi:hypothetical protein